jgi:outer membrane biosynthesis protein TonB
VKDPDSSSDVKNNESTPEDMSLADLLGGGEPDESSGPKRVDQRDDEPGSGMVRLAEMVASTSTEQARTPSIAPPPAMDATPTGGVATQPGQAVAAAPAPAAKGHGPVYMLIVVIIIVAAGYYFMSNQKADTSAEDTKIAALMEQMQKMQDDSANKSAAEATALQEKMAKMQAELEAERAKKAAKEEEAKAEEADTGEAEADTEDAKVAEKPVTKKTPRHSGGSRAASSAPKKVAAKTPTRSERTSTSAPKKASSTKAPKGTAVLDELLGGGGKEDEKKSSKKAAGGAGGLPKKPTKADVKAAMGPVGARAAKCAKYSTGTVMLRITVGSNGRVKSSKALGSFAGTTAGKCVEMLARTAKLPKFSDATSTFTYPITLR